jgi:hypothetical protein
MAFNLDLPTKELEISGGVVGTLNVLGSRRTAKCLDPKGHQILPLLAEI